MAPSRQSSRPAAWHPASVSGWARRRTALRRGRLVLALADVHGHVVVIDALRRERHAHGAAIGAGGDAVENVAGHGVHPLMRVRCIRRTGSPMRTRQHAASGRGGRKAQPGYARNATMRGVQEARVTYAYTRVAAMSARGLNPDAGVSRDVGGFGPRTALLIISFRSSRMAFEKTALLSDRAFIRFAELGSRIMSSCRG